MPRYTRSPSAGGTIVDKVKIYEGGTSAITAPTALANLDGVPASLLDLPGGIASLDANKKIKSSLIRTSVADNICISGPLQLQPSALGTYIITNYDSFTAYTVTVIGGTISRSTDTISYTAPATGTSSGFIVNGKTFPVSILQHVPSKPTVTSPVSGATSIGASFTATSSSFAVDSGTDTHAASDWQLSTTSDFSIVTSAVTADTVNKTSWAITGLATNTKYYVRVRYKGTSYGYGPWSTAINFTTKNSFVASSEQGILLASDPTPNDYFGFSVALSTDGSYAVVGAYNKTGATGNGQGAVYVFLRTGGNWTQQAKLLASDPAVNDRFGHSVDISSDGSYVAIGAVNKNARYVGQGAVYVFLRTGTTWAQQAKLLANDPVSNDNFGQAVSLSGDAVYLAVGDGYRNAAYVFLRTGTTWAQQTKLLNSDPELNDSFGYSLSFSTDGSYLAIGAFTKAGIDILQGAVYVFLRTGATWAEQAKLLASDASGSDNFGLPVSINGDGTYLAIGAVAAGSYQGAVYVFLRTGTTWAQQAKLVASDVAASEQFGQSVCISKDGAYVIAGAAYKSGAAGTSQGATYIFKRVGSTWTQQTKLLASNAVAEENYGAAVTFSANNGYALVGATGFTSSQGAVYVYS